MAHPMVPEKQRFPEPPCVSMMVRLILQLLATKTSVKRRRHKAAHVWCCSRLSRPSATLQVLQIWRSGAACLHRGYGFVHRLRVPTLQDKLLKNVSPLGTFPPTNPFPSSVSPGHDDVQRETRRQRVKRHMRAHTVAEPRNIQQKVHRTSFRL